MTTTSWWGRLKAGLKKSTDHIGSKLREVLLHKKLDEAALDDIEDLLIQADIGVSTASSLRKNLSKLKLPPETSTDEVLGDLSDSMKEILAISEKPLSLAKGSLNVVMMVGVNGFVQH